VVLRVTKDRLGDFLKTLRLITQNEVLVGIPAEAADRKPDPDEHRPLNNAEIGYILEHGAPEANIPARPHLVIGIQTEQDKIEKALRMGAEKALSGDAAGLAGSLVAAGLVGERAVKKKITDGPFVPLAPMTIAKRKAKGRTSEKPLIDTGQYRNAITSVVRPRSKRNG
jgi:hypothetical protein